MTNNKVKYLDMFFKVPAKMRKLRICENPTFTVNFEEKLKFSNNVKQTFRSKKPRNSCKFPVTINSLLSLQIFKHFRHSHFVCLLENIF